MTLRRMISEMVAEARGSVYPTAEGVTRPPREPARPTPPPEATPTDEQRPARRRPTAPVLQRKASKSVVRGEVRAMLASPAGVRRALVLQEILGPPKALRGPEDA